MKRQHPTDPNLFWCPKCGGYYPLTDEFWYWRNDSQNWRPFCKVCHQKNRHKYQAVCINCGNNVHATLEQIKKGEIIFCSHKCRTKEFISTDALDKMAKTQIKKGERKSPSTEFRKGERKGHVFPKGFSPWNDTKTIISCAYCGKNFKVKPRRLRVAANNYCSKACSDKSKYNGGYEEQARRRRKDAQELNDRYIKTILSNAHIDVTPEIIDIKRQQLTIHRELKQLKGEVNNGIA